MRIAKHISLGVALALVLMTGSAAAERVWTKTAASLYASPSEDSQRVARIQANRSLTVVGKKGRWLKVKKGAKSGWIHRAQVRTRERVARGASRNGRGSRDTDDRQSPTSDDETSDVEDTDDSPDSPASDVQTTDAASPPREPSDNQDGSGRPCPKGAVWCGEDGAGDAIHVVVIPEQIKAYKEPGTNQQVAWQASKDQELVVIGYHRPDWFYVQTLDGSFGWILKTEVRQKGSLVNPRVDRIPELDPKLVDPKKVAARKKRQQKDARVPVRPRAGEPGPLAIHASAGAGVAVFGRSFTATNMAQADYEATSTGVATDVSARVKYRVSGAWHAGADGSYTAVAGLSGLSYAPGQGDTLDVGAFILHRLEASAKFGYASSFDAFLRAGFLVETFYLNDLFNEAFLPRERLLSPSVGIELGKADLFAGLGLTLRVDLLLGGSLAQTRGLEDGDPDGVSGLSSQIDASYPIGRRLAIHGTYRFDRVGPSWTGTSTRALGVNGASRTDQVHRLLLGVGMGF